jgi:hypothetical protein
MTRSKAIRLKCLDCSGESAKEVTLCHCFDCPLWPFRIGLSPRTEGYKKRVQRALDSHKEDVEELKNMGIDISNFLPDNKKAKERGSSEGDSPKKHAVEAVLFAKTAQEATGQGFEGELGPEVAQK